MMGTNLQFQLTSFIGREDDLEAVRRLLASSRLVTLTGVGGSGKTRLAIQVATSTRETYPDGVWLVDLAPARDPALVPQVVAQTLGFRHTSSEPLVETLGCFLEPKRLLLILDNCEHLRDACAHLAGELLSHAPELYILATSREPLGLAGETRYPLSGMAWPDHMGTDGDGPGRGDFAQLSAYGAVHLFTERARACVPNFRLTVENARAVTEICRRLDGLPLALELASARVNILTVHEIASRLAGGKNHRFALHLAGPQSGDNPRHHTLRDTIDWSYALLPLEEQTLFRRLAIFEAGFTLETAGAVCMDEKTSGMQVLNGISSLVQKSLVVADTLGRAQARYRLLETIREYGLEKLEEANETAKLRNRHLDFFLAQSGEAGQRMGDAYQQLWLNWLDGEQDNVRSALDWALESNRIEEGLRLASGLVRYWEIRSQNRESLAWFERLLARAGEDVAPVVRVNGYTFASFIWMFLGDASEALRYGQKAVDLAEAAARAVAETDDKAERSEIEAARIFALSGLSSGARTAGDFLTSYTLLDEVTQYYRENGGGFYLGMALLGQGDVAIELGELEISRSLLNEALVLAQEDGDIFRAAHAYNSLGDLARFEGKDVEALSAYRNSEKLLRQLNDKHDLASILCNLGRTYLRLGDFEQARLALEKSMEIQQAEKNQRGITECMIGLATVAIRVGLLEEGVCLIAACEALGKQPERGVWRAKRMGYEDHLTFAREKLGESAFQARQAAGRGMIYDQAVDYARNLPWQTGLDRTNTPDGLTSRELEIVTLIEQGKTNGEIAAELIISRRTVETHVSHILSKLNLNRRAQILHWAVAHSQIRSLD